MIETPMSTATTAYLAAEIGGEKRQFALLADRALRIGRSDKNNIVIADNQASRYHAMLQRVENDFYYLTDLGSSNGTFVNGSRISAPVILKSGDRITIGEHNFVFFKEEIAAPDTEESAEMQSTKAFFAPMLISVLVADIRDFTGMARNMEPRTLSLITGTLFRQAGKALKTRDAWAQKYIGDAVMAVWLHRNSAPASAEFLRVFEGLSELAAAAANLQESFGLDGPVRLGASVNTGWASVGNVGSIASSDYTALGDVVNQAFRLESATRQLDCDLVLGQGTFDFLKNAIDTQDFFQPSTVKLKGYDEPTQAYTSHLVSLPSLIETLRVATTKAVTLAPRPPEPDKPSA
jgi:adenylate cyclase